MKIPYAVKLEAGRSYAWCACGRSSKQPLCDGSHKGSGIQPRMIKATETLTVALCGCKQTRNPPYCDGSHAHLSEAGESPRS